MRWFLPLHQAGGVLGKQISIGCREMAPRLLCFPAYATVLTLISLLLRRLGCLKGRLGRVPNQKSASSPGQEGLAEHVASPTPAA